MHLSNLEIEESGSDSIRGGSGYLRETSDLWSPVPRSVDRAPCPKNSNRSLSVVACASHFRELPLIIITQASVN